MLYITCLDISIAQLGNNVIFLNISSVCIHMNS